MDRQSNSIRKKAGSRRASQEEKLLYLRARRSQRFLKGLTVLLIIVAGIGVSVSLRHLIGDSDLSMFGQKQSEKNATEKQKDAEQESESADQDVPEKEQSVTAVAGSFAVAERKGGDLSVSRGITGQESLGKDEVQRINRQKEQRQSEVLKLNDDLRARLYGESGDLGVAGLNQDGYSNRTPGVGNKSGTDVLRVRKANNGQIKAATNFFKAYSTLRKRNDWKEFVALVRDPEKVLPKMEVYYFDSTTNLPELASHEPTSVHYIEWRGMEILRCDVNLFSFESRVAFLVMDRERKYKLDWESFVHYLPMPWEHVLERRIPGEMTVRVVVEPSIDYHEPYADSESFAAFSLSRIIEDKALLGYAERGTIVYRQLMEGLGSEAQDSDKKRSMVLKIRYPRNAVASRQVEITGVVSSSWLIP